MSFDPFDPQSYPQALITSGIEMIRITRRKKLPRLFKLNIPSLTLTWNPKSNSKIDIDKIQSIRIGDDAKNYREEFNVSSEFHDLWITVIYTKTTTHSTTSNLCNDLKALHMIATTKRNYDIMLQTLTLLFRWSKDQKSLANCFNIDEFSTIKWNNKIKKSNSRETLSFDDIVKLTLELHIYMNTSYLKQYFNECDADKKNSLTFQQFKRFVYKLRKRSEFNKLFTDLGIRNGKMSKLDFQHFLVNVQDENFDDSLVDTIFEKFSFNNNNLFLTPSNLANYLHSSYSKPLVNEDSEPNYYSHPLTDYFVSSSHNTYLLGKQFHGSSSIEGYIHALQRGCRCIEIDIWDGELNNPIVTHGRTLTNSIDFRLVIDIIRKYAFIATPYPLILSLEIKCSKETQSKCVSIMKSIFGHMLLSNLINSESILPSPEDLKHKILIKVKKSNLTTIVEPLNVSSNSNSQSNHLSFSTSSTQSDDFLYNSSKTEPDENSSSATSTSGSSPVISPSVSSFKKLVSRSSSKTDIISDLTSLAPYLVGIKFRNFSLPESKTFNHVFSFSDRSLLLLLRDKTKLLSILKHNRRGMMRIYPSIVRFRSDNFNPIKFWELGCQMVATNWQIWDCGEELCESFFASTGSDIGYSGYRLKPKSLRKFEMDDTNVQMDKELIKLKNLNSLVFKIEKSFELIIISGQQLPKPKEFSNLEFYTPWVELEVYNVKPIHGELFRIGNTKYKNCDVHHHRSKNKEIDDTGAIMDEELEGKGVDMQKLNGGTIKLNNVDELSGNPNCNVLFKTRLAENSENAFNPSWNILCKLKYLTNENDLSFIRIVVKTSRPNKSNVISKVGNVVVKNSTDIIIASWCCKISDLKNGYRNIPLGDNKGAQLLYSSLFIKVMK